MSTYRREHYLAKLRPFYNDSGLIKVITGIRRCGKSSLLITVLNELFEQGMNICSFQGHCYCRRRPIALFDDYCGSRPPLLRIKATGC